MVNDNIPIPETDKFNQQVRLGLILEQSNINGTLEALREGQLTKYYNIIEGQILPNIIGLGDSIFFRKLQELREIRNYELWTTWKGKKVKVSKEQQEKVNFEFAKELFTEINLLGRRQGLIGMRQSVHQLSTEDLPDFVIEKTQDRMLKLNKNWMCVIEGETGSGKTYSALTIAKRMYPDFCIDDVVFSGGECIKRINELENTKGATIVFDEAGVSLGSRDWQSSINKNFNKILQSFRHLNQGIIFTLPSFNFLDVGARMLVHTLVSTKKINLHSNICRARWYNIEISKDKSNPIKYRFNTLIKNDELWQISDVAIPKPPPDLVKAYEKKKLEFSKKLRDEIEQELNPQGEYAGKTLDEMLKEVLENPSKFENERGRISRDMLKELFKLTENQARALKTKLEIAQKKMST